MTTVEVGRSCLESAKSMSPSTLVDTNVLLDVFTRDPTWAGWSEQALAEAADQGPLVINPIIYAEVSVGFDRIEELDLELAGDFVRSDLPWEAAFLAGKCHLRYRKQGGTKHAPLPDLYIGAHAAIEGHQLLTRDARRFRTYFPSVKLISPN
ncbi:type II toxin-antitoxin system VapC family toxin [Nocardiopsis exhalans]|uniref:Type II toxin-antitoxin system VapC family toxin n=1 Tax=Nocardiopsis exhalans TaxID=163604 RepID=A0ABY5D972_9ACTN|nr:type II toxin-antitoxin system VapC family toxin [Nocardiopsis exhalans]USY19505.1 type II toxin-antitoxin system VapC family toxin [Nocardiopsis exhalans]